MHLYKKLAIIAVIFAVLVAVALGLVTKYAYIDENAHYHTGDCYINNCTIGDPTVCGIYNNRVCYIVNVTYNLSLLNGTHNYSQQESGIIGRDDFCDWTSLICFYDDRDIAQSLRLWVEYTPNAILGVILLGILLGACIIVSIFFFILYKVNGGPVTVNTNEVSIDEIKHNDNDCVELSEI